MDKYCYSLYISLLLLLSIVTLCHGQTYPSITQPMLTSVIPLNSTALNVTWQFANVSIDQSNLIQIYIVFYEFYYSYSAVYASTNFTFTSTNKTITNLIRNFELVNAYYYVCFSSNSTVTNASVSLGIVNTCRLTRTCPRSGTTCPGPSSVTIAPTTITRTSFILSFLWPNDLPYTWNSFSAQLISNGQIGTSLGAVQNTSYTIQSYQFTGLQSKTVYTVNASFTYTILNSTSQTNVTSLTVTTSSSSKLRHAGDFNLIILAFAVTLSSAVFSK